jgi:hypothetical protein
VEAADEEEFVVERICAKRYDGTSHEYEVKWKGLDKPKDNTWETADAFDPAMLAEFEAMDSKRKETKLKATKKRAPPETEAAVPAKAVEAAKEQSLERIGVRQLREGDNDWDLIEEPCFICRHPCFFSGVISNHKAAINAATTYDPMENKVRCALHYTRLCTAGYATLTVDCAGPRTRTRTRRATRRWSRTARRRRALRPAPARPSRGRC